jgi:hypothetical protein
VKVTLRFPVPICNDRDKGIKRNGEIKREPAVIDRRGPALRLLAGIKMNAHN